MKQKLFHGTKMKIRREFDLLPGPNNAFGLGVYLSSSLHEAVGYGDKIIVITNNGRLPIKKMDDTIHVLRGGLRLRLVGVRRAPRDKKRPWLRGVTFYYCKIVKVYSLEEASRLIAEEKVVFSMYKEDAAVRFGAEIGEADDTLIEQVQWRSVVRWEDPQKPRITDVILGKVLGIGLKVGGFIAKMKKAWYEVYRPYDWLGHYLVGLGGRRTLSREEVKDLLTSQNLRAAEKGQDIICRPDPRSPWFNTLGTFIARARWQKRRGSERVVVRVYDVYRFARQPGQMFSPYEIKVGGCYPLIWATSAFKVKPIIGKVVRLLQKVSPALRAHVIVTNNNGGVLISNGLWKALGGKEFITEGKAKFNRKEAYRITAM